MIINSTVQARADEDFSRMARQVVRWVDRVLGPSYQRYNAEHGWAPAVNIYEDAEGYHVVVDLAGTKAEEIDLHVENGLLRISGRRPMPMETHQPQQQRRRRRIRVHVMEIDHGSFCRNLELPSDVNAEDITANYRGGFLRIHMPRRSHGG